MITSAKGQSFFYRELFRKKWLIVSLAFLLALASLPYFVEWKDIYDLWGNLGDVGLNPNINKHDSHVSYVIKDGCTIASGYSWNASEQII